MAGRVINSLVGCVGSAVGQVRVSLVTVSWWWTGEWIKDRRKTSP